MKISASWRIFCALCMENKMREQRQSFKCFFLNCVMSRSLSHSVPFSVCPNISNVASLIQSTKRSSLNMKEETFTVTSENYLPFSDSLSNNENLIWVISLQRSQLVLTIVGCVANIGTSLTLIKNGQVSMIFNK